MSADLKSFGCNPVLERLQSSVCRETMGLSDLLEGQRLVWKSCNSLSLSRISSQELLMAKGD